MYGIVCHNVVLSKKIKTKDPPTHIKRIHRVLCYTMFCAIDIAPLPPLMSMEASIIPVAVAATAAADCRNPAPGNTH